MRLLCIGDVVSDTGRDMLYQMLPVLKRQYQAERIIVNGENAALGNGIDARSMRDIFSAGADVVTGGNHSFQKKNAGDVLEDLPFLLRPANFGNTFGNGWCRIEGRQTDLFVLNLQGMLFLPEIQNPFEYAEKVIAEHTTPRDIIVVDFHAEASSEKQAMGYFLDGKVSLVFGTHTHVQTNDERILSGGTGYITDIGMTGPIYSVLGKAVEPAVHNFRYFGDSEKRKAVEDAPAPCQICGIFAEIDDASKKCVNIDKFFVNSHVELDNLNKK